MLYIAPRPRQVPNPFSEEGSSTATFFADHWTNHLFQDDDKEKQRTGSLNLSIRKVKDMNLSSAPRQNQVAGLAYW